MLFTLFIACIFVALLFWYNENFKYWRVRKIKHDLPIPLFGNHIKNCFGLRSDVQRCTYMYNKYRNEKIVGYYRGNIPELIIRDPNLIKYFLNRDFLHFYGRGLITKHERKSLLLNVFHGDGDEWKILRHVLTPAFTSSKLRNMFPLIQKCLNRLQIVALDLSHKREEVSAYDLMSRYTIELIGACGFGLNLNTLNKDNSMFLELGKLIFSKKNWQIFLISLREIFPQNIILKNISIVKRDVERNITTIAEVVRKDRKNGLTKRNDFIDLLLELEKTGTITGESLTEKDKKGIPLKVELKFTEALTNAQLFIFFAAGFETSASTTSWTLYQLAHHPEIQRKVQDEIDETLKKHNDVCYDAILELRYLEMTVYEALRTFSPGGYITRACMKRYVIPEVDVVIDPGVVINIPVQAIHLDAQYYDSPLEFRPERFSPEEEWNRHKYVFLPFGDGPRKCFGRRLGLLQTMAGLVAILQKFNVEPVTKTKSKIKTKANSFFVQAFKDNVPIMLKPRVKIC